MLRKLIVFAITSGLAKKAWDRYMVHHRQKSAAGVAPKAQAPRGTSNVDAGTTAASAQPVEPASPMHYH
ncbi:hypothetical protein [Rhizobacter sp. LjRoot28]|jgi:hypothetical protein|uniref:hypothetical protein n=1 Tax=Rhizobacter sp. LjRoot28 TaxID=3342309 RepID=UPI003ED02CA5